MKAESNCLYILAANKKFCSVQVGWFVVSFEAACFASHNPLYN